LARRDELEILRFVGASRAYIQFPLLVGGAFQGLLGASLALGLLKLLHHGIEDMFNVPPLWITISFLPQVHSLAIVAILAAVGNAELPCGHPQLNHSRIVVNRSHKMTAGLEKAPHRSLLFALGMTREEMKRPLIGVVNSANEIVPGHMHLDIIARAVKDGVRMAGGTPMEFPTIGVCDGLAMNHEGMKMSLPSRELIADSIEISATAVPFDGLVFIPNCDKIVPGMLMAMLRLNIPSIMISGGPMLPGKFEGRPST
jgi:hypothetical protein